MQDKNSKKNDDGNQQGDRNSSMINKEPGPAQRQYLKWLYTQRKKLLELDRQLGKQLQKRETLGIDESRNIVDEINKELSDKYDPVMLGLDSSILSHLVDNLGTIYEDIGKSTMLDLDVVESFDDDLITVVARLTRQKRSYSCPVIIKQKMLNFKTVDFDPLIGGSYISPAQRPRQENLDVSKPAFKRINIPKRTLTVVEKERINQTIIGWAEEERLITLKELKELPYEVKSTLFKLFKLKRITLTRVKIRGKRETLIKLEPYREEKDKYREQAIVY
ncbi:MAG: hypothetical protein ACFFD4_37430 [Candidatus Odinarchaeota archaeon]